MLLLLAAPAALAAANAKFGPTSEELEQDISQVDASVADAKSRCADFGAGSVLKIQCDIELGFLSSTRAMLQQKKLSWLRWINLNYTVPGQPTQLFTEADARDIEAEMAKEQKDLAAATEKATNYGGLIQTMALVEMQTKKVAISVLRLKYLMGKYGVGVPAQPAAGRNAPTGRSVDEKGAL
ncbi:hypothetical protein [Methylobacterium segetis]|uniref:hypothetical protein n=1 Tax=Methylobacterium segetis TaxID=2488750 RepID=UPI00104ED96E|nr:hypothetical protein [Methylobacterium segetis]